MVPGFHTNYILLLLSLLSLLLFGFLLLLFGFLLYVLQRYNWLPLHASKAGHDAADAAEAEGSR